MEQYIKKSALVAEIKRLIKHSEIVADHNAQITELVSRELDTLYHLISFLDTLEVKDVDLEQISKHYALNNSPWDDCWPEVQDAFKAGFELGLKAQKGGKV